MFGIEKPRIQCEEMADDYSYGRFVVEPLERGYGMTLGNSLRRILLSSLPGAAVTSVQIEGVLHEFSTAPGVLEDITDIILNLKGVAVKMYGDEEQTVYLEAEGPCEVTAKDIHCGADVEIINGDLSRWWKRIVGVPLWGNTESTRYGPVSDGRLPEGAGKWVK